MNFDQVSISLILIAAFILFAWGKLRYDIIAMFCLMAAVLLGVVPEKEAFSGFWASRCGYGCGGTDSFSRSTKRGCG